MTGPIKRAALAFGWYNEIKVPGIDPAKPGIYEWRIEGIGVYVGQYTRSSRPYQHYARNVTNILNNRPYRKGKPDGFRAIHRQLAEAVRKRSRITLTLLENVEHKPARNRREQAMIDESRREATRGGLPVLNSN